MKIILSALLFLSALTLYGQSGVLKGKVLIENEGLGMVNVSLLNTSFGAATTDDGDFSIDKIPPGKYRLKVGYVGFKTYVEQVIIRAGQTTEVVVNLVEDEVSLEDVVVSGTMKEVTKLSSPVPVEVYSAEFFQANPSPSIFESLQNINGVRPQLNCNVCNTGDIHINGLEGPYTMVLIDGMPIVSGLSTVYGLTGIPQALIERIEIVKGPASTLYGSEAVGGLINLITKKPSNAPAFSADVFTTSWGEINTDIGVKLNAGKMASSLLGLNYFNYQNAIDNNNDGFTDVPLQDRISIFNKWSFHRKENRVFSLAGRYVYEDRWGGEMNWDTENRGGSDVYGESIYTSRWELFGVYQLPVKEKMDFQFSANNHDQNSVYGDVSYIADQFIAFGQLTWDKRIGSQDLLMGLAYRYTDYDDNTPATATLQGENEASITHLPGIFIQDEWKINEQNKLLMGLRYDYNSRHGGIFSPRLNYKWNSRDNTDIIRVSIGNGYRVANVFTEDHAALSGGREVVFQEELRPETSWNANFNYVKKIVTRSSTFIDIDASLFYTHFQNRIIADYDTDPNLILYNNLDGYAIARGFSTNMDISLLSGFKALAGFTFQDVFAVEEGERLDQLLTESFSGVWSLGYTFPTSRVKLDYTGNLYGPMRLPLLGELDPRRAESPWWSIQNIQATVPIKRTAELFGGVKNILNYTPPANSIARASDPFDRGVQFGSDGQAIATPGNPNALTFDPAYMFAPNQGTRFFIGLRTTLN